MIIPYAAAPGQEPSNRDPAYCMVGMMKLWSEMSPEGQRWVTVLILV
jgi:hypothetical protein